MNVENLMEKIDLFSELVIESGFIRDLEAYQNAIQQADNQSNLVALKSISANLTNSLEKLIETDLSAELHYILPNRRTFTDIDYLTPLVADLENPTINTAQFFNNLNSILSKLKSSVNQDVVEIKKLRGVFSPYVGANLSEASDGEKAIMAIILRDLKSIKTLKSFTLALDKWNKTLYIYHQIITSHSPEEFSLIEISQGSIDVLVGMDTELASNLTEVFEIALSAFSSYLAYKTKLNDAIPTNLMTSAVKNLQDKMDKEMLFGIKAIVVETLKEQHATSLNSDPNLRSESIDSKINEVSSHIIDQVLKGNEIKLLSIPESEESKYEVDYVTQQNRYLREKYQEVRSSIKKLDVSDIKLLEDTYEQKDDANSKTSQKKTDKPD